MIKDYNTYTLSKRETLHFCLISGLVFGIIAFLFYNNLIVSLLFSSLSYPARKLFAKYMAEKRKRELLYQFRDLLYALSSSISAGRQMRQALIEANKSMRILFGDKALISRELEYMIIPLEESGESEESVLLNFADRSSISDIINFVDIYRVCKDSGADMEWVIRKTVGILIDRIELEKEVRTLTAQKRLEFSILTAMPIFTLLFLRISSPSYLEHMYGTMVGWFLMSLALISIAIAAYLAFRITNIRM